MATRMRAARLQSRFGIGEWNGKPFTDISPQQRRHFAEIQFMPQGKRPPQQCNFLSSPGASVPCWKVGGVCSLRKYDWFPGTGAISVSLGEGTLRTTCPSRFEEDGRIYRWIGEVILNTPDARPIGQVSFLQRAPLIGMKDDQLSGREEVGRIDNVLIVPDTTPLQWCAVEIQAVYFSGDSMKRDFERILEGGDALPFPVGIRRPDYRSSGPKRLMPQLQIKVPTLRRWGKRMAVVVDEDFFKAMGRMKTVDDMSNCDVAWFVVKYDEALKLARGSVHLTTLEESVQSLVAGQPVSLPEFEERILAKLSRLGSGPSKVRPDN